MDGPPHRAWFNLQITATLLFSLVVTAVGVIGWALTSAGRADQALQQVADLRVSVVSERKDQRAEIEKELDALRTPVGLIPGQEIHLQNIETWINHTEQAEADQSNRIDGLERQVIQLQVQLAAITQASSARLGHR